MASLVGSDGLRGGRFRPYSNVYPGLPCDETPFIRSIHEFTGVDGTLIDTSGALKQIDWARETGRQYVYLGMYVAANQHLNYKARFLPQQRLIDGQWCDFNEDGRCLDAAPTLHS